MAVNGSIQFQNYVLVNGTRFGPFNEILNGSNVLQPELTIPASTSYTFPGSAFATSKLLGYSLYSTPSAATVKFASTAGGTTTSVALTGAATPQIWSAAHGANPLATDCVSITVVNATTTPTDISLNILLST